MKPTCDLARPHLSARVAFIFWPPLSVPPDYKSGFWPHGRSFLSPLACRVLVANMSALPPSPPPPTAAVPSASAPATTEQEQQVPAPSVSSVSAPAALAHSDDDDETVERAVRACFPDHQQLCNAFKAIRHPFIPWTEFSKDVYMLQWGRVALRCHEQLGLNPDGTIKHSEAYRRADGRFRAALRMDIPDYDAAGHDLFSQVHASSCARHALGTGLYAAVFKPLPRPRDIAQALRDVGDTWISGDMPPVWVSEHQIPAAEPGEAAESPSKRGRVDQVSEDEAERIVRQCFPDHQYLCDAYKKLCRKPGTEEPRSWTEFSKEVYTLEWGQLALDRWNKLGLDASGRMMESAACRYARDQFESEARVRACPPGERPGFVELLNESNVVQRQTSKNLYAQALAGYFARLARGSPLSKERILTPLPGLYAVASALQGIGDTWLNPNTMPPHWVNQQRQQMVEEEQEQAKATAVIPDSPIPAAAAAAAAETVIIDDDEVVEI